MKLGSEWSELKSQNAQCHYYFYVPTHTGTDQTAQLTLHRDSHRALTSTASGQREGSEWEGQSTNQLPATTQTYTHEKMSHMVYK